MILSDIKGISVILYVEKEVGFDDFNHPIVQKQEVVVENVLVSPVSSDDASSSLDLYGRKAVYELGIPKNDDHSWENAEVFFFGRKWRTIGIPIEGIPELIPLEWNKKVKVAAYE